MFEEHTLLLILLHDVTSEHLQVSFCVALHGCQVIEYGEVLTGSQFVSFEPEVDHGFRGIPYNREQQLLPRRESVNPRKPEQKTTLPELRDREGTLHPSS